MKILCHSYAFSPSLGGIENVSEALLAAFVRKGHEVVVVTKTAQEDNIERPYEVYRNPSKRKHKELYNWCDLVWQNNMSVELIRPFLLRSKPRIVTTQTWLAGQRGKEGIRVLGKRIVLRFCRNIAISQAVQEHIMLPAIIVGNPYDDSIFKRDDSLRRDKQLLYVGRLVSDKGVDLLLESLSQLKEDKYQLTIVGDGPEKEALQQYVVDNGLDVHFVGVKKGQELCHLMNQHKLMVVPSTWAEPFGIVALEGMASGCYILGANSGGLPDAIGPGGTLFERSDVDDLSKKLRNLFAKQSLDLDEAKVVKHLEKHTVDHVANRYLRIFERAL